MKIFFFLFVCAITLNACTVKDDIPSTPVEISSNDNAKIQQLTLQIELLNKEYQSPKQDLDSLANCYPYSIQMLVDICLDENTI